MMSLGASSSFQTILNNLNKTSSQISLVNQRLSSGKLINSGRDNPVLVTTIGQLTASINGFGMANNNISTASGMLNTAEGGLSQMMSALQELRAIAVQSADGTLSGTDRSTLTNRAGNLLSSIDMMANGVNFNGVNLLDGSFNNRSMQIGPNEGDTVQISMTDVRTSTLNVDNIDLNSQASAGNAISTIDSAINAVASAMASVGSSQSQVENISAANEISQMSLTQARSNIEDLDYGAAVALRVQLQIKHKAQIQVLNKTLEMEKSKVSLLA